MPQENDFGNFDCTLGGAFSSAIYMRIINSLLLTCEWLIEIKALSMEKS